MMEYHRFLQLAARTAAACCIVCSAAAAVCDEPVDNLLGAGQAPRKEYLGLPLVFFDNFEEPQPAKWEQSDPNAWKFAEVGKNRVYSQFRASQVETPVRSPFNRALVKGVVVGDFVLDVKLQSTIKDYDHRDMCLFFGFQDAAHLYYVHLGKKADDHANQIFIVNNEPRKKISATSTSGTPWTDGWHHARVVRKVETGAIEVYFDDMQKPVMTASDKTFAWGQVGIGTFDDTGNFDDVIVYGKKVERPALDK
ncbi:MAG: hypothetical protein HY290_05145 [Planctomycetia bacterium]|nr:hypothetical protein [Planctomycetia bacterium]